MKKLLTVTCLAGLLSIPSVVFAEASWYGSIRVGVESDRGADGVESFGSRWGVQGSSEISEGLTAVYKFEESLDAAIATVEDNGRLSYVGLSGGFGTVTVGQVWSATYNIVGSITDKSTAYGDSGAYLRYGNAISYAVSVGNLSMQADAILDSGKTGNTVDHFEFGVSMDVGDIGKIAFAHRRIEDDTTPTMVDSYTSTSKVMESAVLKSTNDVTGGIISDDLEVGVINVEGDVPLPISGKLAGITTVATKQKVAAVLCLIDKVPTKVQATTGCGENETELSTKEPITMELNKKPLTIETLPDVSIDNQKITTAASGAKFIIKSGEKNAGTHDVKVGKRWTKSGSTNAEAAVDCVKSDADDKCIEKAYHYYVTTDKDGKPVKTDILDASDVTSNVNLVHTLTATGGDLKGDVKITDVEVETETEVVTDPKIETTTTKDALQTAKPTTVPGETANFIAGQVTLGGITGYLGYTEVKTNGIDATASTTHAGIRGSAGETGVSYFVQLRNQETASPWLIGLSKTLGGGASLNFEYGDEDKPDVDHRAGLWLQVDF